MLIRIIVGAPLLGNNHRRSVAVVSCHGTECGVFPPKGAFLFSIQGNSMMFLARLNARCLAVVGEG